MQFFSSAADNNYLSQLSLVQLRELHARALQAAEAKRTELRLVVTSRYKELVGSRYVFQRRMIEA